QPRWDRHDRLDLLRQRHREVHGELRRGQHHATGGRARGSSDQPVVGGRAEQRSPGRDARGSPVRERDQRRDGQSGAAVDDGRGRALGRQRRGHDRGRGQVHRGSRRASSLARPRHVDSRTAPQHRRPTLSQLRMVREVLMRHGLFVLTALCAAVRLDAQGRISGTVTDSANARPIAGATVVVLGTNRTAATNTSGAYVITDVPAGTRQVRARFVGYASVTQGVAVDGVPLAGGIEDFNPATIQSIEVLKDASATAVYGSRGSNGVILITTRRGAAGVPDNTIRVSYDAQYGAQSALNLVDMMNGPET